MPRVLHKSSVSPRPTSNVEISNMSITEFNRKPWVGAAIVVAAVGFLYFRTAARDLVVGDAPEFIPAAAVLGVPHPPGYPLFTILGHAFSLLPWGSIPFRVNLLSVVCDSFTAGIVFLIAVRLVRSQLAAAVAALVLAVNPLFWSWSLSAEVFPLNNLLAALLILFVVIWYQQPTRSGFLIASFFIAGLGLANQQTIVLLAPAFCFLLWRQRAIFLAKPGLLVIGIAAFLGGLLPYAYLPWASARHPAYIWSNISSIQDFVSFVSRKTFGSTRLTSAPQSYLGGSPLMRIAQLGKSIGPFAGTLMLLGAVRTYRSVRWYFWFSLCAFAFTGPLFAWIADLNLKTAPVGLFVLQRFFLLPQVVAAPLGAFGIVMTSGLLRRYVAMLQTLSLKLVAAACFVAIATSAFTNYSRLDQSRNFIARHFAEDIFMSAQSESILLTTSEVIAFPIIYFQTVEKLGRQITLIWLPLLLHPWYVRQLRERHSDLVIPFDAYDNRSNNLKVLVDANPSRKSCFIIDLGYVDHSLESSYWPYQLGLLTVLEPKSKALSLEDLFNDNKQLLERYQPPNPGTVKKETFERYILLAYAWPEFQIAGILERAGARDQARVLYQRALQVDPDFREARDALARLGH